jgi:general secretion pathway protein N
MTRPRLWIAAVVLLALLVFTPLRFATGLIGLGDGAVSARSASGLIWAGRLDQARVAGLDLGTLDVGLHPLPLALGRARIGFERSEGNGAPLSGAIESGIGRRGFDGVTGSLPGGNIGGLPVESIAFDNARLLFVDGQCREAGGRVTLTLGLSIAGLELRNGLSGDLRCEGREAAVTLAGQSGLERLTLTVDADGKYVARLGVQSADPLLGAALSAAGFGTTAEGYVRTMRGRF